MASSRLILAGSLVLGSGFLARNEESREGVACFTDACVRGARDAWFVSKMVADYQWTLRGLDEDERQKAMPDLHQRNAQTLKDLFCLNRGVYVKIGQNLATLDHLLPEAYVETMRCLYDDAPISGTADDVRHIIEQDLGCKIEDKFATFEMEPMASASLAQVHRATTHDGQRVAVKVQHRGLREASAADIATIKVLVDAVEWMFPQLDYGWLVREFEDNLPVELDFVNEARNCERAESNFVHRDDIKFPRIHWDATASRVLTMDFMDGPAITDLDGIKALGLNTNDISTLVSQLFNEMIYLHGFVHCDPHPGNVLVRRHKGTNRPELVLLDHGLYRDMNAEFRLNYCHLWKALMFADIDGIQKYAKAMNCPGTSWRIFASMLTAQPWSEGKQVDPTAGPADRDELQNHATQYLDEISDVLAKIPRQVLLLLKTNDCIRSINVALDCAVNTPIVTARYCVQGINQHALHLDHSWSSRGKVAWERFKIELRILMIRVFAASKHVAQVVQGSVHSLLLLSDGLESLE